MIPADKLFPADNKFRKALLNWCLRNRAFADVLFPDLHNRVKTLLFMSKDATEAEYIKMLQEINGVKAVAKSDLTSKLGTPPTPLQRQIWSALDGKALKKSALAKKCGVDEVRLYYSNRTAKTGGLRELMTIEAVKNKRGVGYYRPDAPPRECN